MRGHSACGATGRRTERWVAGLCLLVGCSSEKAPPPATQSGSHSQLAGQDWAFSRDVSAVDSSVMGLNLTLNESRAQPATDEPMHIGIICKKKQSASVVINVNRHLSDDSQRVRYRIDGGPIETETWFTGGDGVAKGAANSLVRKLIGGKRFAFELVEAGISGQFDVGGLRRRLPQLRESCPPSALPPAAMQQASD